MIKRVEKRKFLKYVIPLFVATILVGVAVAVPYMATSAMPKLKHTIVIDAGHGGRDGGSVGVDGSVEKDLNLEYAKSLQKLLTNAGIKVVMTRSGDTGLYNESADNKKLSDMRKRRDIINNSTPDLVISIHMNSFPLDSCQGAKTFYQIGSDASFEVAKKIQSCLSYYMSNTTKTVSEGDYYILNCTKYTSVLVECGFVSSPEEVKLLNNKDYREKFTYSIYRGIMIYLGF